MLLFFEIFRKKILQTCFSDSMNKIGKRFLKTGISCLFDLITGFSPPQQPGNQWGPPPPPPFGGYPQPLLPQPPSYQGYFYKYPPLPPRQHMPHHRHRDDEGIDCSFLRGWYVLSLNLHTFGLCLMCFWLLILRGLNLISTIRRFCVWFDPSKLDN